MLASLGFTACAIITIVQFFKKRKATAKKFGIATICCFWMVATGAFIGADYSNASATSEKAKQEELARTASRNNKETDKQETKQQEIEKQETEKQETDKQKTEDQKTDTEKSNMREENKLDGTASVITPAASESQGVSGELKVHFINVGQADSILIIDGNKSMLIDAGNNPDGADVVNYIKEQGIKKLDIVIGTHAHEDHIGGMDTVIKSFDIGQVFLPKTTHSTKTFEDVLLAIKAKGLKISSPTPGTDIKLNSAMGKILAPNGSDYKDLNDGSIVVKLNFGNNSFMFTGDAEEASEREILGKGFDVKSDLLKVGHHGSYSSTTDSFLKAVNPKYAVIMVGKDNSYGHPHKTTVEKLKTKGIKVYRTDELGTIIATSDGKNITFNTKEGSYAYAGTGSSSSNSGSSSGSSGSLGSSSSSTVGTTNPASTPKPTSPPAAVGSTKIAFYTPGGKSYHFSKSCSTLSRSKTILEGNLSDVIALGKDDPCDRCAK
jgi:competence protein ComEC